MAILTTNSNISLNTNTNGQIVPMAINLGSGATPSNPGSVTPATVTTANTITNNAQPNITSVGTLISLNVSGNIAAGNANLGNAVRANYFVGNGNYLSNINAANLIGTAPLANYSTYTGTVVNNAQPNITSIGTLTSLSVSGNTTSGNANLGNLATATFFSGSGSLLTALSGSNVIGTVANSNYSMYAGLTNFSSLSTLSDTANTVINPNQSNITSVGTLTELTVSGRITPSPGLGQNGIIWPENYYGGSGDVASIKYYRLGSDYEHTVLEISNQNDDTTDPTSQDDIYLTTLSGVLVNCGTDSTNKQTGALKVSGGLGVMGNIYSGANIRAENCIIADNIVIANDFQYPNGVSVSSGGSSSAGNSISNGTSNVRIPSAGSNVAISVGGTSNVIVITTTGANILGNVNANYFIGDGGYLSNIPAANITGSLPSSNVSYYSNTTLATSGIYYPRMSNTVSGNLLEYANTNFNINLTTGVLNSPKLSTGDTTINGNLTVSGTTLYANVTSLAIKDPLIEQGGNPDGIALTSNDGKDRGQLLKYYTTTPVTAFMGWITRNNEFAFGSNVNVNNEVVTFNSLANVRARAYFGEGTYLANISGPNVIGQVPFATVAASATTAATVTGTAQANITSLGALTSLNVIGNASFTGSNVYIASVGSLRIPGGTSGYVLSTDGAGTLSWIAQSSGGGGSPSSSSITNGSSNVNIASSDGNITAGVGGVANVVVIRSTGVNVTGTINSTGNLTAANANLGNLATANYFTGTLTTNAQPNITSVGTLTSLITGDTTINGNLTVTGTTITANVITVNIKDPIVEQGGTTSGALSTNDGRDRGQLLHYYTSTPVDAFMGWDNSNAEFAFGSNVSVSSEVVTFNSFGNIRAANAVFGNSVTADYFVGNGSQLTGIRTDTTIASGTSNINIGSSGSNVAISVAGISNVVVITTAGMNVTGNANVSGNITASHFIGSGNNLSNIQGANITGTVANANYAAYAGNIITAAQPNITSVGTLTTLGVTGNITSGNANLGNAVRGNYFIGDGSLLTGIVSASNSIVNGTSNIAISSAGSNITMSVNGTSNVLVIGNTSAVLTGNLTSTYFIGNGNNLSNIQGDNVVGNVPNANTANISFYSNTTTATTGTYYPRLSIGVTGNLLEYANSNLSFNAATGTLTSTNVTTTANITTGNITTGNITTGNIIGTSINVTATASFANAVTFGNLTTFQQTCDVFNTKASQTGTVAHDFSTGGVWYHTTPTGNITANITNVPTTNNRVIVVPILVAQNATGSAYIVSALQIDGVAQTIKWASSTAPTGTINKVDVFSFTLLRNNSTWTVLGDYSTYG